MDEILTFRTLDDRIRERGDAVYGSVKERAGWRQLTWRQLRDAYLSVAALLQHLQGDARPTVAIVAGPGWEWNVCDFATLAVGGVVVGLYANDRDEVLGHVLSTSRPTVLVVEDFSTLERVARIDPALVRERPVIVLRAGGERPAGLAPAARLHLLSEVLERKPTGERLEAIRRSIEALRPEDVASHVYTSGTSGLPRAAILTQGNLLNTALTYARHYPVSETDETLLFLPFAHVFSRVMYYSGILWGVRFHYVPSLAEVAEAIRAIAPTVLLVVPRMLEKVRSIVLSQVQAAPWPARRLFDWALEVGARYRQAHRPGALLSCQHWLAWRLALRKLAHTFGPRLRFIGSGGGRLAEHVAHFYASFGISIYEGYATTESGGLGIFCTPASSRPGTVGRPVPEIEVRLAEDGEICLRSASVFAGYLGDERATHETLRDGWLHTGDIGAIDDGGWLRVIDRKKDIFATAYGKKVAPSWVEAKLTERSEIADAVVFGDDRPYLVALVVPGAARAAGGPADGADSAGGLEAAVAAVNERLARHEQVKRFHVVPDLSSSAGAMTSTMKKRREAIYRIYAKEIEALYA